MNRDQYFHRQTPYSERWIPFAETHPRPVFRRVAGCLIFAILLLTAVAWGR